MNIWTKSIGLLAASTLVLGACNDDDNNGNNPDATTNPMIDGGATVDATTTTPDATPLSGVDAICAEDGPLPLLFDKSLACNPSFGFFEIFGTDLLSYQFLEALCRENVNSEVGTGNITIDDTKIQACIDYINATDCENLTIDNLIGTPCEEMMIGSLVTGAVCEVDGECAGDAYCEGMNECGTCVPRAAAGQACADDEECTNGKCNSAGVCATAIGLGGACLGNDDCIGILDCHPMTNVCALVVSAQGDACADDDACGGLEFSQYCQRPQLLGGGPQILGTCQPMPVVGETCVPLDFVGAPACQVLKSEWCNMGTCAAPAMSMAGEACNILPTQTGGARKCNSGLMCSNANEDPSVPGVCVTPGQNGASCDFESKAPTNFCHPFYECTMAGMCELDLDVTGMCPANL